MMRFAMGEILAFILISAGLCQAASLPKGTSFIGFRDGVWNVYLVKDENSPPQSVKTVSEPRAATFSMNKSAVVYVAADGKIREVDLRSAVDRVLLESDKKRTFAQPSYNVDGTKLLMVDMKDGRSGDSKKIALFDIIKAGGVIEVTSQPTSQLEPRFATDQLILYSSVSCTLGCGKIIQEIWRKDIVTETADQVTLLNAIARQPVASSDGKWIYFSSNKAGSYHIWRVAMSGGTPEQVTKGKVTDVSPVVAHDGRVCFLRTSTNSSGMVCKLTTGEELEMDLPTGVQNIRNLEISVW
ncbi:MAG: hypothetical protein WC156_09780 [Pedobacter sp.]